MYVNGFMLIGVEEKDESKVFVDFRHNKDYYGFPQNYIFLLILTKPPQEFY